MQLFAIGVGGTGAKCLEALVHLQACGALSDDPSSPPRLGTLLVDPDHQSALLQRSQTAMRRYEALRTAMGQTNRSFARAEIHSYGHWSPLESLSDAMTMAEVFPRGILRSQSPALGDALDCLFPREEQEAQLDVGFRGRPPIGAAVMSRIDLDREAERGAWRELLAAVRDAAGLESPPVIHLFGSVFGGTGASGVPTLGRLLRRWLKAKDLGGVRVHATLLLPYFDFESRSMASEGVHAQASNFQLNTDAALQFLRSGSGQECFDRVYLLGNDVHTRYSFSIGGTSQANEAHLVELIAALAARHGLHSRGSEGFARTISRRDAGRIGWEDLPDAQQVGPQLRQACRFAVAWRNNIAHELAEAQTMPMARFLVGAPWARHFFRLRESQALPEMGAPRERQVADTLSDYLDTLLQWLEQLAASSGTELQQELLRIEGLRRSEEPVADLSNLFAGSAAGEAEQRSDSIDTLKLRLDRLSPARIPSAGMAGLVDGLWTLCA